MRFFTFRRFVAIVLVTGGSIAVFGLLGFLVGGAFGRSTVGLIAGVVVSFVPAQWLLARLMRVEAKRVIAEARTQAADPDQV